jgi:hypothetical protein
VQNNCRKTSTSAQIELTLSTVHDLCILTILTKK